MRPLKGLVLQLGLPLLFLIVLPLVWTDSGVTNVWEHQRVPEDFYKRLLVPTYLLLTVLALQTWLLRSRLVSAPREDARPGKKWWRPLFWSGVLALFLFRAFEHHDVFPVHHDGEANSAIIGAAFVAGHQPFSPYNLGFGLLFYPFFSWLGYTFALTRLLTTVTWGLALLALFVLFSRLHRSNTSPLVFVPVAVFSMILPSLRTYTWHAGAAIASVAVFFLAAAIVARVATRTRLAYAGIGGGLYLVGLTAYHAVALYAVPLLVTVAVSYALGWRPDRSAVRVGIGCFLLVALSSALVLSHEYAYPLADRLSFELSYKVDAARPHWNWQENLLRSWDNLFYSFFWHDASFPMRAVFLLGVCACLATFRTCLFARTSLLLFVSLYGPQWFLWGHGDWSQNAYTIVPILGILLVGLRSVERTLALVRPRWAHGVAVAILVVALGVPEYRHYFTAGLFYDRLYEQDPFDTRIQHTLALRDARKASRGHDHMAFFMPAANDPGLAVRYDAAGVEFKHPRIRRMLSQMKYFTSPEDLARQVRDAQAQDRQIRIYFGVSGPQGLSALEPYMEKLPERSRLIREEPYRDVLGSYLRLFVTYVDVPTRGGAGTSATAPGRAPAAVEG